MDASRRRSLSGVVPSARFGSGGVPRLDGGGLLSSSIISFPEHLYLLPPLLLLYYRSPLSFTSLNSYLRLLIPPTLFFSTMVFARNFVSPARQCLRSTRIAPGYQVCSLFHDILKRIAGLLTLALDPWLCLSSWQPSRLVHGTKGC